VFVTRKADYAVRCVLFLTRQPGRSASVDEISKSMLVPRVFLAKIMQRLTRAGIASSARGAKGGFRLARDPEDISLFEVIETIQGPLAANICAVDKRKCSLCSRCAVHPAWVKIRELVERELKQIKFSGLAEKG
jgi:Rrf2 family protein